MKRKALLASQLVLAGLALGVLSGGVQGANAARPGGAGESQAGAGGGGNQSAPARPMSPVGSAFTYQGRLDDGPNPANGQYDFQFRLYDAASGGSQVGSTLSVADQTVTDGLFSVTLDFGVGVVQGDARWLEMDVRTVGGGSYTTLSPRDALTATPYALSLVPGAVVEGSSAANNSLFKVTNNATNAYGVWGVSTAFDGIGVLGSGSNTTTNSTGVYGIALGTGVTGFAGQKGVYGLASGSDAWGVHGVSNNGIGAIGVRGESSQGTGVLGISNNYYGVEGRSSGYFPAVIGNASGQGGVGVKGSGGLGPNAAGVVGEGGAAPGVLGGSNINVGVYGQTGAQGMAGVYGKNWGQLGGYGVQGDSESTYAGVFGNSTNPNGTGVVGLASGGGAKAVRGINPGSWAGWFDGNVNVTGSLSKGAGSFKIDHPLDPENKYLYHSFVESPDMMNIYNGNITTDAKGEATVTMPAWFDALNRDFRYQLTVIGQFAQAIVSSEMKGDTFSIMTDKPNVKVSWQVTGIRKDAYANAHRILVEQNKTAEERGKYLHPKEYGQPESKGIDYEEMQKLKSSKPKAQKP